MVEKPHGSVELLVNGPNYVDISTVRDIQKEAHPQSFTVFGSHEVADRDETTDSTTISLDILTPCFGVFLYIFVCLSVCYL